jgi:DNA modification methylase
MGFDLGLMGFDMKEIEKLFAADEEAEEDTFDVDAELEKPTFSALGDVWTLGRHRLIVGDSTKPETYAALMQGKQANLIMTDPPYGIDYDKGTAGKIKNDKFDSDDAFYTFRFDAFKNMADVLANDGAAYVFHADSKGLTFRRAFEDAGFKLSGCCIWAKNTFTLGRSDYQWCHEPCLYGWKKSGKHNWYGDRKQSTIWKCDKPSRSEKHPTMKPIPLLAPPIQNSTQTNGVVLDPFGGSGSTLICCEQLNRVCYTIELDPKFADVIVNRYMETVGSPDDPSRAGSIFVERDGKQIPYAEVAHE